MIHASYSRTTLRWACAGSAASGLQPWSKYQMLAHIFLMMHMHDMFYIFVNYFIFDILKGDFMGTYHVG